MHCEWYSQQIIYVHLKEKEKKSLHQLINFMNKLDKIHTTLLTLLDQKHGQSSSWAPHSQSALDPHWIDNTESPLHTDCAVRMKTINQLTYTWGTLLPTIHLSVPSCSRYILSCYVPSRHSTNKWLILSINFYCTVPLYTWQHIRALIHIINYLLISPSISLLQFNTQHNSYCYFTHLSKIYSSFLY